MSTTNNSKGKVVGFAAKSRADCAWTPLKVEFYRALRKLGEGSSEQISRASNGKVDTGHARHFGYHGVGGGLVRVEPREDVRGFTFVLTTKGRALDLAKVLEKKDTSARNSAAGRKPAKKSLRKPSSAAAPPATLATSAE